jgi:hypothetical protein
MRLLVGFDRRDGGRDALVEAPAVVPPGIVGYIGIAPCPVLVVPRR